ncbi:hypothetical protein [Actinomadura sp. 9N407]|uniref:hypothetical protein n=1 Tax=Actinomadura sp. 9N407 TaxID=3375154 RepID=UPI0037A94CAE
MNTTPRTAEGHPTAAPPAPAGPGALPRSTEHPVPRWINWIAHAVPFTVLPSGLWRIALGLGVPMGFSGELAELYHGPDWVLTPYVVLLSLLTEGFALLTLGLVRPWGEVFPRWMPFIGGRTVPVLGAVSVAALGAVAVTMISAMFVGMWSDPESLASPEAPQGLAAWLMTLCYLPFLAWGPLLAIVTVAYYLRRRGLIPFPTAGRDRTGSGTGARP